MGFKTTFSSGFCYGLSIWNPTHLDKILQNGMYVSEHDTDMYVHVHDFMNVHVHLCACTWIITNLCQCNMYIHFMNPYICFYMLHTHSCKYIFVCTMYIHVHALIYLIRTLYRHVVCTASIPHFNLSGQIAKTSVCLDCFGMYHVHHCIYMVILCIYMHIHCTWVLHGYYILYPYTTGIWHYLPTRSRTQMKMLC
jgi:hypothetical protein